MSSSGALDSGTIGKWRADHLSENQTRYRAGAAGTFTVQVFGYLY